METVLVCVSPAADYDLYRFFDAQFKGKDWEPYVVPVTEVEKVNRRQVVAVVAHATDWPAEHIHTWLMRIRSALGPHKRLLALLPKPPEHYPPETRALWDHALGYGFKVGAAIAIVDDFIAGRV